MKEEKTFLERPAPGFKAASRARLLKANVEFQLYLAAVVTVRLARGSGGSCNPSNDTRMAGATEV